MKTIDMKLTEIKPYDKNPRDNDGAVDAVAASIQEFGFKQPIVVDKDGVIIVGHTRYKAAQKLNIDTVPVLVAKDLTDEQVKAYRLADNKTAELAGWDFGLLNEELFSIDGIDMEQFGFDVSTFSGGDFFAKEDKGGKEKEKDNEEYNEFVEKFEPKRTTDDCYTPSLVYDSIADFVSEKWNITREKFVRPFYPGGDYERFYYPDDCCVVDNPPFSILSAIVRFYIDRGIKFFLFAPALTLFSSSSSSSCAIPCNVGITYDNGALISTSFLTNLDDARVLVIPELYQTVKNANDEEQKKNKKELPLYKYPKNVITSSMCGYLAKYGQPLRIEKAESERIACLDSQKEYGKGIFGSGYLLSEKAAAEKAAAEKAAAEKAAAEKAAAIEWKLSEREREIIKSLG